MRRVMCIAATVLALAGAGAGSAQAVTSEGPAVTAPSAQAVDPGSATRPADAGFFPPGQNSGIFPTGSKLCKHWAWTSGNLRAMLVMQADGNLALYKDGRPVWQTGTVSRGHCAVFQADGNFVVYDVNNTAIWASNTANQGAAALAVQDDGNVVIYSSSLRPIWDTQTSG